MYHLCAATGAAALSLKRSLGPPFSQTAPSARLSLKPRLRPAFLSNRAFGPPFSQTAPSAHLSLKPRLRRTFLSNRAFGAGRLDRRVVVAELPEDLPGVLAKARRGLHLDRRARQLDRTVRKSVREGKRWSVSNK